MGYVYMGRWVYVTGWTIEETILYSEMTTQGSCISVGVLYRSVARHHLMPWVWHPHMYYVDCVSEIRGKWGLWELLIPCTFYLQWIFEMPGTFMYNLWNISSLFFPDLSYDYLVFLTSYLLVFVSVWITRFSGLAEIWPALKATVNRCPNLCPPCNVLRSKDGLQSFEWLGYVVDGCISLWNGIYASLIQSWLFWSLGHL